jgi:hypothetical protein
MQAAQGLPLEMRLMEDLQYGGASDAVGHSPGGDHRVKWME